MSKRARPGRRRSASRPPSRSTAKRKAPAPRAPQRRKGLSFLDMLLIALVIVVALMLVLGLLVVRGVI